VTDRIDDRAYLTDVQYASDANLAARQAIYEFRRPRARTAPWAIDLAALTGDEPVLDLGCGNGLYLRELDGRAHRASVIGMDLSAGMLPAARAQSPAPLLAGDAQRLPFRADSFGCVLVMHMLYHVPDQDRALGEVRRVLRPGGVALVLTNSVRHLEELNALVDGSGGDRPFARAYERFSSESGEPELRRHFSSVERHDSRAELVITGVRPVVDYAASEWSLVAATDDARGAVLAEVGRRVAARIASDGAFRVRVEVGCFVCR
jgi:ubiquinone/menaquinone biosynthesis C-methylase UbiE